MHLLIDGFDCPEDLLASEEVVHNFLDGLPDEIGMLKITEPKVLTYNGAVPEDWGVTGFVVIAESHISVHTFAGRGYINVDVFSCKDFDADFVEKRVIETFAMRESKTILHNRGLTDLEARNS